MNLQNIMSLAQKHMFFTPVISNISNNVLSYCYGPAGSLFIENIKSEWLHSNVINRDVSVFLFTQKDIKDLNDDQIYMDIKDMCNKQLPFGIAKVYNNYLKDDSKAAISDVNYFNPLSTTCLSSEIYVNPFDGNHYFLHWQRQRKLWWKKMSHSPSRFSLSEIYKLNDGTNAVDILVKFPWGNEVLEIISVSQYTNNPDTDRSARHGRKNVFPYVIKNLTKLETAALGLFCDAVDEKPDNKTQILRIHKKLSPYKCILSLTPSESEVKNDVSVLAFSLTKQLRKGGVSTLLLNNNPIANMTSQLQRNDEWGIPYTIIVDSSTLKTGVLNIRDRDTSLNEEVHISEIVKYMKRLIKDS